MFLCNLGTTACNVIWIHPHIHPLKKMLLILILNMQCDKGSEFQKLKPEVSFHLVYEDSKEAA